jgi:NitT/TauT family transport system substrate-binding protein
MVRTFAALLALLGIVLGALPGSAQAPPHIRLITTPSDSGAQAYYADALGLFKKAGLDVEVTSLVNGAAVAAAIASGAAEIGQGNLVSLALAHEKGLPFVLIAPAAAYLGGAPTSALIVPNGSTVTGARDLVGKPVAVGGLKDIGSVALDMWLLQQGVDPAHVNDVEIPGAQIGQALERGNVVAAISIEPYLSRSLAGGARLLAPTQRAIGGRFLIGAYFSTSAWAKAHPDLARKVTDVMIEAARWANVNHARSAEILEQYTKVRPNARQVRVTYAETLDAGLIQPLLDACVKDHVLMSAFPAAALLPS